ncbi:hypothetical protein BDV97DRAFT_368820 [Delphinella strobiligena]|nr:hypothetical protein BDV97DRAFT_368820 [Delphinella strobiligena]
MAGPSHLFESASFQTTSSFGESVRLQEAVTYMADMAQQLQREVHSLYTQDSQSASISTESIKRERSPGSEEFYLPPHKRLRNSCLARFASLDVGVKIEAAEEEEEDSYSSSPQSVSALREDRPPSLDSSTDAKPVIWAEEPFHIPTWLERRRSDLFLQYIPPYTDRWSPFSPPDLSAMEADSVDPSPHHGSNSPLCKMSDFPLAHQEEYQPNLSPLALSPRTKKEILETESVAPSPLHQNSDAMLCHLGEYALTYPEEYQLNLSPVWPRTAQEAGGVSPRTIEPSTMAREDSVWSTGSEYAASSLVDPSSPWRSGPTLPISQSRGPIFRDPFAPCIRYCVAPMSQSESEAEVADYESEADVPGYDAEAIDIEMGRGSDSSL